MKVSLFSIFSLAMMVSLQVKAGNGDIQSASTQVTRSMRGESQTQDLAMLQKQLRDAQARQVPQSEFPQGLSAAKYERSLYELYNDATKSELRPQQVTLNYIKRQRSHLYSAIVQFTVYAKGERVDFQCHLDRVTTEDSPFFFTEDCKIWDNSQRSWVVSPKYKLIADVSINS